ncbi:MAG: GNAT family N-acetyltransferase [Gammaproteobacteria bacterium]|nr:GNAT family N-acetyltransferase [Gammaproteobacteria bacterium]
MTAQQLTIGLARSDDAYQFALLSRELIEQGLGWSWTAPRILRQIQSPDALVAAAWVDAELVGFAIMYFAAKHGHLNLLAVQSQNQRRGVGRSLIRWLEESARVAGISDIYLEVRAQNMAARNFYKTLGYVEFEEIRGYYNRSETAIRMVHDIRVNKAARVLLFSEIIG